MYLIRRIELPLVLLVLTGIVAAQPADDVESPHATSVNQDFSKWCQVGDHHFTFERTSLQEIVHAFGCGKIVRDSSPGAAVWEWFICYRWRNQIVTFASNSDMGGPSHDLEEVDIREAPLSKQSQLPSIHGDISFPFGAPGMSFHDLQLRLGKAPLVNGHVEYQYPGSMPGTDYNGKRVTMDISGWLRAKVLDGKLVELEISRVTSY